MALGLPSADDMAKGYELVDRHFGNQETMLQLLRNIADNSGPGVQTLAITEQEVGGGIEVDFPVEGGTRWIVPRLATGGTFIVPSSEESSVLLLGANNRRLGGTIVNRGQTVVNLILASPGSVKAQKGLGEIYLRPFGGSWDFRLGSLLWCGSICAYSDEQESEVTIVEV